MNAGHNPAVDNELDHEPSLHKTDVTPPQSVEFDAGARERQGTRPTVAAEAPCEGAESATSRKTFKWAAERVTFALAIIGAALGVWNFIEGRHHSATTREIQATRLLDQAWDILGGNPGTATITEFAKDRSEHEKARRLIWQARQYAPALPAVYRTSGALFFAQARPEKAIAAFRRAIQLQLDYTEAHVFLGFVLHAQGRLEEAEASHRQATLLDPEHAVAHSNLGRVLQAQGRLDEAEASYRRAIQIDPQYPFP
jgi:tetratricopeptide (TPR) repeat protein